MSKMYWSESLGRIELEFIDADQVLRIFHQGDCESSTVAEMDHFIPQLEKYPEQIIIDCLSEAGFEREEMEISPQKI